jgi:hypothetical protein
MAVALAAGCAATKKPAGRLEDAVQSRATVTQVDLPARLVTLRDERGQEVVLLVPHTVKDLDQVMAGDAVVVSYTRAVAWQVKRAGDGALGVSEQASFTTGKPGDKPGATLGHSLTMTATISAIDLPRESVTLIDAEGRPRTIRVREPADLRKVQLGDLVDITYSEAVAVAVRPVVKKE